MSVSKEQLLDSIHPGMKLDKAFFLKVYGYEISYFGFADEAIQALEAAGCSKAREYYDMTVSEYEKKRNEELKPIARQLRKQWERDWEKLKKEGEEKRKQEEMVSLRRMSNEDLIALLENLTDAI